MKEVEKALKLYFEPISGNPGILYLIPFLIDYVNYIKREPVLKSLIDKMIKDESTLNTKSGLSKSWTTITEINTATIEHFRDNYTISRHREEVDIRISIKRIHNYLLEELSKNQNIPHILTKKYPRFDEVKSILFIGKEAIKFRKFTEQYHTLRIIFGNTEELSHEWFYSEIRERIDGEKDYTDKDFHNYLSAIKRRIASETAIKDLFVTTTQSVKINPDYLKI